jgi:hypothetical protein
MSYGQSNTEKSRGAVSGIYAHFISSSKVSSFETLYKSLLKHYGTADNLEKELKIGKGIMKGMFKDKKLSEYYAKKILDKFNELKTLKAKALMDKQL